MATKERYQNPVVGDTVNLRMFSLNGNNYADFSSVEKVEIYYMDPEEVTEDNPEGRRFVERFYEASVTLEDTGKYVLPVDLSDLYVIGQYIDVWTVNVAEGEPSGNIEHMFQIYPALWYTTPMPIVYDFNFHCQPNKFRKGSKQYLQIEIIPNVPTAGDLRAYYENLAIASDMLIFVEQHCGECLPEEQDLRIVVDGESVDYREKRFGYYQIDTEDMDCGIYNVWFQLDFGSNRYISDKYAFQVYD